MFIALYQNDELIWQSCKSINQKKTEYDGILQNDMHARTQRWKVTQAQFTVCPTMNRTNDKKLALQDSEIYDDCSSKIDKSYE